MLSDWKNKLYFGDNLQILKDHITNESVDLIYMDLLWNKKKQFNVLFRERSGEDSPVDMAFVLVVGSLPQ